MRRQVDRDDPLVTDSLGDSTRGTGEDPGDGPSRRDRKTGLAAYTWKTRLMAAILIGRTRSIQQRVPQGWT